MNSVTLKCCGKRVKLADNSFMQQKLSYFQPHFRPRVVLPVVLTFGICCAAICALLLAYPGMEYRYVYSTYDRRGEEEIDEQFIPEKEITPPSYLMYEIRPFVGGNRFYRNSISPQQFMGESVSAGTLKSQCNPTDPSLDPCGLVYVTRFNDTFSITDRSNNNRPINASVSWHDISYPHEDKRYSQKYLEEEDFGQLANWMRPSGTNTFRKTFIMINETLTPDKEYNIHIRQNWPLSSETPDAYKAFVILKPGMVGTPNLVLVIMSGIIGAALILASLVLFILYAAKPASRKYNMFGDVTQQMGLKKCK